MGGRVLRVELLLELVDVHLQRLVLLCGEMVLVHPRCILLLQCGDALLVAVEELLAGHGELGGGCGVEVGVLLGGGVEDGGEVGIDVRVAGLKDGEVSGWLVHGAIVAAATAIRLCQSGGSKGGRHNKGLAWRYTIASRAQTWSNKLAQPGHLQVEI